MKVCAFCNTECEDEVQKCPSCGAADFSYKCYNCGEVFDSGFCPNCGVEAGNKGKMCPNCNKLYFGRSCPDCGYREIAASANKTYKMSEEAVAKANGALKEKGEGANTIGINGKNLSPEALMLAEMAMNREDRKTPLNFSAFMPKESQCSRGTAIMLCILLGWLGGHQFYVGNSKKGLLYLCTMGLFGVGIILDLIALINNDFTDSKGLPLKK